MHGKFYAELQGAQVHSSARVVGEQYRRAAVHGVPHGQVTVMLLLLPPLELLWNCCCVPC